MSEIRKIARPTNEAIREMAESKYKIGNKVKRTDIYDSKIYVVKKIRYWKREYIYSMENQTWADGWAWVPEIFLKFSEAKKHDHNSTL